MVGAENFLLQGRKDFNFDSEKQKTHLSDVGDMFIEKCIYRETYYTGMMLLSLHPF